MKRKMSIGTALLIGGALAVSPATAGAKGNAYGNSARECVAGLGLTSLGAAIQAGRAVHPGAKITAKTIATSIHCVDGD